MTNAVEDDGLRRNHRLALACAAPRNDVGDACGLARHVPRRPLRLPTPGVSVPAMHGDIVPAKRFARLRGLMRASFGLVVDVALPQLCPSCRQPVEGAGLCPGCWSKLSFIAPPYCERLGIPFPFDAGPGLFRWRRLPIRPRITGPARQCATTRSRASSSMP